MSKSRNVKGTVLRSTAFAIAADLDGSFTLYTPQETPNIPVPQNIRVLTAFAMRLDDPVFVEEMLTFLDDATIECPPDCPECGGKRSRPVLH